MCCVLCVVLCVFSPSAGPSSTGPPSRGTLPPARPPSACKPPWLTHNDPRQAQTHFLGGPWPRSATTIPREDPPRGEKTAKMGRETEKEKREIWALHPLGPLFWVWAPTLRLPLHQGRRHFLGGRCFSPLVVDTSCADALPVCFLPWSSTPPVRTCCLWGSTFSGFGLPPSGPPPSPPQPNLGHPCGPPLLNFFWPKWNLAKVELGLRSGFLIKGPSVCLSRRSHPPCLVRLAASPLEEDEAQTPRIPSMIGLRNLSIVKTRLGCSS